MKRFSIILAVLAVLLLTDCSKKQRYTIQGSLGNLNAPATVYLLEVQDQAYVVRDSAVLENGKFTFEGDIDSIIGLQIVLNREGSGYERAAESKGLFLEDGVITIKDSTGSLREAVISGTPNNDAQLRIYKEVTLPLQEAEMQLTKKQQEATPEMLEDDGFKAELAAAEAQYLDHAIKLHSDFIQHNPNVIVSLNYLMRMVGVAPDEQVESLYNNLSSELRQSPLGQDLATRLARIKLFAMGVVMPEITLPDTNGNPISSTDFKGQYLLVDLWAAWCAPCRVENPNLVAMYRKYQDKNFNILGISLDNSRNEWLVAIQKDKLTWPQVSDLKHWNSAAIAHFGINSIPTNYLLDPSGKIIAKDLRGQALRNKLEELLEKGT
ncbi:TlpA disulfide reductase family protein [Parapedobacter lycopersici]|uniref:TlpA disulfide reductase family protein n=1 Tax=Parapedobacter lycopersici TaxID=1864939 RepID=UPI0033408515